MMPNATMARRTFLLIAGAGALTLGLPRLAAAQAGAGAFVQQVANQLTKVTNGNASAGEKRQQMKTIIDQNVDVSGVAQFCLGRFWNSATPEQQQTYVSLFHDVLITSFSSRVSDYKGVTVTIGNVTPRGDTQVVSSTVDRPGTAPAHVDWVVGGGKIVDLVAEGTSMRLTQRSDYASFMSRNGNSMQALLNAMRQQIAANSQG